MYTDKKWLQGFFLAFLMLLCSTSPIEGITLCALHTGMIPDDVSAAQKNAEILANIINSGKTVNINKTFYIGDSPVEVVSDVIIKGTRSGNLILTGGKAFKLGKPVSISVSKLRVSSKANVSAESSPILFFAEKPLIHKDIAFSQMIIDGVRLYSQKKDENYTGDVGLRRLVFENNEVKAVGRHLIYMANCQAEEVVIKNNRVTNMLSIAFLIGLNEVSDRRKMVDRVSIKDNIFDNVGVVLNNDYTYTYHTPLLIEANQCECTENVFKNYVSTASKPIALYAAYLSCNRVVFEHNKIENCIALGNSTYNEVFKCKSAPTKGEFRQLTNNEYVVTPGLLSKYNLKFVPKVSLLGLQMSAMDTVIMSNNKVDVACDFVFGATTQCVYKLFQCENNTFSYRKFGKKAKQLIRLKSCIGILGSIIIKNNIMKPKQEAEDVYGLFAYDSDNYHIIIEDNILSGALPYGDNDGKSHQRTTLLSKNNRIDLGSYTGPIRISHDMNADDEILGGKDYQICVYATDQNKGQITWRFKDSKPIAILPAYSCSEPIDYSIDWHSLDGGKLKYDKRVKDNRYTNMDSFKSVLSLTYNPPK